MVGTESRRSRWKVETTVTYTYTVTTPSGPRTIMTEKVHRQSLPEGEQHIKSSKLFFHNQPRGDKELIPNKQLIFRTGICEGIDQTQLRVVNLNPTLSDFKEEWSIFSSHDTC